MKTIIKNRAIKGLLTHFNKHLAYQYGLPDHHAVSKNKHGGFFIINMITIKHFAVFISILFNLSCSNTDKKDEPTLPVIPNANANCSDGIRNGTEQGVDCGGLNCNPCPDVKAQIPTSGFDAPNSYSGYDLVWNDEFNEADLDTIKWSFHLQNGCPNLCGWGNNELQYYTDENFYFDQGNLVIEAKNEPISGFDYTSTRIHSDDKFEFKFGRVDIRASMPSAVGSWTALWLINKNYSIEEPAELWPLGGEIDIMEYLGEDKDAAFGTAHFGSDLSTHRFISGYYDAPNKNYDEEFYVYSIIWEEDKITWLINNVPYHSITPNSTNGQPYPFNDEFYFIMNLSVGGNLPVAPILDDYPTFLIIDYIRVYQPE